MADSNILSEKSDSDEKEYTQTPVSKAVLTPDMTETIFKWLIRNQTADGFFSKEDEPEKNITLTSLAVLSFIGQGHTDRTGKYKPQIGKAITNIVNNLDKMSAIPFSLSAWVIFELYNLSQKKKDKDVAEKALQKLKDLWSKLTGNSGVFLFCHSGKNCPESRTD